MGKFFKTGSLFDLPKDKLNPHIFSPDNIMLDSFRNHILIQLHSFITDDKVNKVYLLGSNAGRQYNENSDIDISVMLEQHEDRQVWHPIFKAQNATIYPGTSHPVNFFAMPYSQITKWEDATYAIYNITDNHWEKYPRPVQDIRNPADRFNLEIKFANMLARTISKTVDELLNDIGDLNKLIPHKKQYKRKIAEIERDINILLAQYKKLDIDRKTAYSVGFGTPRDMFQNIVYKFIEHSQLSRILHIIDDQYK